MKFHIFLLMVVFFGNSAISEALDDDTLLFYLSKSELVIVGTIISDVWCLTETGVPECSAKVNVENVIFGGAINDQQMDVTIINANIPKKGMQCILFLRHRQENRLPIWETADFWFGVQHYSLAMQQGLDRIVSDKKNDAEQVIAADASCASSVARFAVR